MHVVEVAVDPGVAGQVGAGARSAAWDGRGAAALDDGPGTRVVAVPGGLEVEVAVRELGTGLVLEATVVNPGRAPRALTAVRFRLDGAPRTVLETGHQGWSPIHAVPAAAGHPVRRRVPGWARATWHAAPWLAGRAALGDQYLVHDSGAVGFLGGARHCSTVVCDPGGGLWVAAWMDGVVLDPGAARTLEPLWWTTGDPGAAYSELMGLWGERAGARTGAERPFGWCSWYQYFAKVRPQDVRANLALAAGAGFGLVQIDDGYQRAVGDWLSPSPAWASNGAPGRPDALAEVAGAIGDTGLRAGVWTAPFLADHRSELLAAHPDWFVRDRRGRPLRAMWNPLSWGGWAYALDTTRPEVLEHVSMTLARLSELGFGYHKLDFCYAATMPGRRAGDGRRTRAEALRAGLEAVRAGAGEDAVLLGCGCPFGPAVGMVDAMRVSPDTAPRWGPGLVRMPGYPDTAPAARNAVRASVLRAPMHRRLWLNDPDCLVVRPKDTALAADRRALVATVVEAVGGVGLFSDDLATYGPDEWAVVTRVGQARGDLPLDLVDPFARDVVAVARPPAGPARRLEVRWRGRRPHARFRAG